MNYDNKMIARMWSATARPEHADAYIAHLNEKTLPHMASLPGHRGAYVLRRATRSTDGRAVPGVVAFTVITLWESLDAIARFTGADVEAAVVPPEAQALLASYDDRAVHWDVVQIP